MYILQYRLHVHETSGDKSQYSCRTKLIIHNAQTSAWDLRVDCM